MAYVRAYFAPCNSIPCIQFQPLKPTLNYWGPPAAIIVPNPNVPSFAIPSAYPAPLLVNGPGLNYPKIIVRRT